MRLLFSRAQFASTCVASGIDNLLRFTLQWRAPRNNNLARLLEAVGLGLFTIGTIFFLSYFFGECVDVPAWHEQVHVPACFLYGLCAQRPFSDHAVCKCRGMVSHFTAQKVSVDGLPTLLG